MRGHDHSDNPPLDFSFPDSDSGDENKLNAMKPFLSNYAKRDNEPMPRNSAGKLRNRRPSKEESPQPQTLERPSQIDRVLNPAQNQRAYQYYFNRGMGMALEYKWCIAVVSMAVVLFCCAVCVGQFGDGGRNPLAHDGGGRGGDNEYYVWQRMMKSSEWKDLSETDSRRLSAASELLRGSSIRWLHVKLSDTDTLYKVYGDVIIEGLLSFGILRMEMRAAQGSGVIEVQQLPKSLQQKRPTFNWRIQNARTKDWDFIQELLTIDFDELIYDKQFEYVSNLMNGEFRIFNLQTLSCTHINRGGTTMNVLNIIENIKTKPRTNSDDVELLRVREGRTIRFELQHPDYLILSLDEGSYTFGSRVEDMPEKSGYINHWKVKGEHGVGRIYSDGFKKQNGYSVHLCAMIEPGYQYVYIRYLPANDIDGIRIPDQCNGWNWIYDSNGEFMTVFFLKPLPQPLPQPLEFIEYNSYKIAKNGHLESSSSSTPRHILAVKPEREVVVLNRENELQLENHKLDKVGHLDIRKYNQYWHCDNKPHDGTVIWTGNLRIEDGFRNQYYLAAQFEGRKIWKLKILTAEEMEGIRGRPETTIANRWKCVTDRDGMRVYAMPAMLQTSGAVRVVQYNLEGTELIEDTFKMAPP